MSRIFRSTTALTAALGLLAPSFASAETVLTQNEFRQMQQRTAEGQPLLVAALENEVAAGLTADGLACMDGSARPCADGVPLKTPMGLAVWPGEDGGIVLAPRKDQDRAVADAVGAATAEADPAARVVAQAEGEVIPPMPDGAGEEAAAEAAQKARQAAGEADGGDAKAERAKRKAERAEAREKADEPVAAEAGDGGEARSERAKERAERAEARERGAEPVPPAAGEDAPSADSLAEALAREGEPEGRSPEARAPEAAEAPPVAREPDAASDREDRRQTETAPVTPDDGPAVAREPDTAADRAERRRQTETAPAPVPAEDAPTADDLAEALGAADDGADNGAPQPVVADTAAAVAAATGQREAPKPVEVTPDEQQALADALAKSEADREARRAERRAAREQAAQQDDAPTPVAPADGDSDSDNDAAAIAAAAASTAPAVAALTAPARLGEDARTVVVTEGSARSSAEDFATSIAEAVAAAKDRGVTPDGQPVVAAPGTDNDRDRQEARRDDDDDDDNTLRNVLLAGLGAYAVGTLLANQNRVALNTGDRVVVQAPDGSQQVWKDDNALLLQPGAQVTTENFSDGSSRSIVTRSDGSRVVTIRDAQLRVLRRTLIAADGTTTELINDAEPVPPVEVAALPPPARPVAVSPTDVSPDELRRALEQEAAISRRFSLSQIRDISQVRNLVAPISIDSITFDTGSAAIRPTQAQQLATLGGTIADMIRQNPAEVFLIEGYTDTVGAADMNLALSDRRAESLALALTEYFQVPPENMVVQGYGERFLKVAQEGDVRANRRVAVRRITDLLQN